MCTSPCVKPIRRPKLANRQAVLLVSGLMVYFPVVGVGRVGVGVVVGGGGVVEVEFVTVVVGAAVVEGTSALQVVTVKGKNRENRLSVET